MPDSKSIKYMSLQEFYELGFLQEVNRQFLHPLGLALSMEFDNDDNAVRFGNVWDYRDDAEGLIFNDEITESDAFKIKKDYILSLQDNAKETRNAALGYFIQ